MAKDPIQYAPGTVEHALQNGTKLLESNPAGALLQARKIIERAPQCAAAHHLLARALERTGDLERARLARRQALNLSRHVKPLADAMQALRSGRAEAVPGLLEAHLAGEPDDPVAHLMLGEALATTGHMAEAVEHIEAALADMPDYAEARFSLARAQFKRFDPAAALEAIGPLTKSPQASNPGFARFHAVLLSETGDHAGAEAVLRDLAAAQPQDPAAQMALGDMLRIRGKTDEAEAAYRTAIAQAPELGRPWWSLASLGAERLSPEDRERLEQLFEHARTPDDRLHLAFAVASVLDKAGEHERAFALYQEANRLRRAELSYDGEAFARRMERIGDLLASGFPHRRIGWDDARPRPIFIVGMARSGSTLLEQMLAGHSAIRAGGEMPIVTALLRETGIARGLDPDRDIVELLEGIEAEDAARLGEEYCRRAAGRSSGSEPFLTDKLPHNWAEIAFIRLILPRAKIVDIRRGALDCCVSNFTLLFEPGHPASYDLADMAEYYRCYVDAMERLDTALPGAVHRVEYEALIDDPEAEMRGLLTYLGLEFEPACLDPAAGGRAVATASAEQVRQPLNRKGLGSWRRFEPWLGDLKQALGPLA